MGAGDYLALDPVATESALAALEARAGLWSRAEVVAVGWTARTVHELHLIAHGLVRHLIGRHAFRSVVFEGDREACQALDWVIRGGAGDLRATLATARPFLATVEMLGLLRWLQQWNDGHGGDTVRIVHGDRDDLSSPRALERSLADQVLSWHERTGQRIVYLGGAYHTAAAKRTMTGTLSDPVPSAGSLLREAFGDRYLSMGLTFGSGAIPQPVPLPAPGTLEAELDGLGLPTVLVPRRALSGARTPTQRPDRVRVVGPDYDPTTTPGTRWSVIPHSGSTSSSISRSAPQPGSSPESDRR